MWKAVLEVGVDVVESMTNSVSYAKLIEDIAKDNEKEPRGLIHTHTHTPCA